MNRVLHIGFIGCGEIAQIMHIPYVYESGNMHVYSLCNTSLKPLEYLSEKYSVPKERCLTDYKDLLKDPTVDAVAISTHDHYLPVMAAAGAGKHIFVEKPLAFNTRQAKEMIEEAEKNGVILQIGYMKAYDPGFEYFLKKFRQLKEISHVRIHSFSGDFSFIPKIYPLCTGGETTEEEKAARKKAQERAVMEEIRTDNPVLRNAYMDMLLGTTHLTVLLREMFGNEIKVRYADIAEDGQTLAILEANNKRFTWESHFLAERMKWDENIYVYSPECELSLHFPSPYLKNAVTQVWINENEAKTGANVESKITASFDEAFRREWQAFYNNVVTAGKPRTDGYGGLCDIRIAGEIVRKAKENLK